MNQTGKVVLVFSLWLGFSNVVTSSPATSPQVVPTSSPSLATDFPTSSPVTVNPTASPTRTPVTVNPTVSPTRTPVTVNPTVSPTRTSVTGNPTTSPTRTPVTGNPTTSPTRTPVTGNPTTSPIGTTVTATPTATPSLNPLGSNTTSASPTTSPSSSQVVNPVSGADTPGNGTSVPALEPTVSPTATVELPSQSPTSATNLPTTKPTEAPSLIPTTLLPSASPTAFPTGSPTSSPTSSPIFSPTATPTKSPTTLSPTRTPTTSPTRSPTNSPTASPTRSPTNSPTASPTRSPTNSPTTSPTKHPTSSPTNSPSRSPTATPTSSPSKSPSKSPTHSPSNSPSSTPTRSPTTPSPTRSPTTPRPTRSPTASPTLSPTSSPSFEQDYFVFSDWEECRVNCTALMGENVTEIGVAQFRNDQGQVLAPGSRWRNASCIIEDVVSRDGSPINVKTFEWEQAECKNTLQRYGGYSAMLSKLESPCMIEVDFGDSEFFNSCQQFGVNMRRVFANKEMEEALSTVAIIGSLTFVALGTIFVARKYEVKRRVEQHLTKRNEKQINLMLMDQEEEEGGSDEVTVVVESKLSPSLPLTAAISKLKQTKPLGLTSLQKKHRSSSDQQLTGPSVMVEFEADCKTEEGDMKSGEGNSTTDEKSSLKTAVEIKKRSFGSLRSSTKVALSDQAQAFKTKFTPGSFIQKLSEKASAWQESGVNLTKRFTDVTNEPDEKLVAGMILNIPDAEGGTRCVEVVDPELLPGWFKTTDGTSGSDYYFNQDGEVTWVHPIDFMASKGAKDSKGVFALFSRLRKNNAQQQLNHFLHTFARKVTESSNQYTAAKESMAPSTTANIEEAEPRVSQESEQDKESVIVPSEGEEELIEGHSRDSVEESWFSAIDPDTQDVYYYNTITGQTTWDEPEGYGLPRPKKWTITSEDAFVSSITDVDDDRLLRFSRAIVRSEDENVVWEKLMEHARRISTADDTESAVRNSKARRATNAIVLKGIMKSFLVAEQELEAQQARSSMILQRNLGRLEIDPSEPDRVSGNYSTKLPVGSASGWDAFQDAQEQEAPNATPTRHVIFDGSKTGVEYVKGDQKVPTESSVRIRSDRASSRTVPHIPPPPATANKVSVPHAPAPGKPRLRKVNARIPQGNTVKGIWNKFEERNAAIQPSSRRSRSKPTQEGDEESRRSRPKPTQEGDEEPGVQQTVLQESRESEKPDKEGNSDTVLQESRESEKHDRKEKTTRTNKSRRRKARKYAVSISNDHESEKNVFRMSRNPTFQEFNAEDYLNNDGE